MTDTPTDPARASEAAWRDMGEAPHETPVIAQFREWNRPDGDLREHVVWFFNGEWRTYLITNDIAYADRWRPIPLATPPAATGALVDALRNHLEEQITHAETRIQDGKDMGSVVWRIALEDIIRENQATLASIGETQSDYVMVPREPTEAMIWAGEKEARIYSDCLASPDEADRAAKWVWRAMLAAASPAQSDGAGV